MTRRPGRLLCWLACVLALSSRALAAPASVEHPRVHLEVSLAGAHDNEEGLSYFVPEVARALADKLRRGGFVVAPAGELVSVTIEERAGDRVLLSARTRGSRADLEGSVESMDALVDALATRLLPMSMPSSDKHVIVAAKVDAKPEPATPALAKPDTAKPDPAKPDPPRGDPAKPDSPSPEPSKPDPTPTKVEAVQPASAQTPPPVVAPPEPKAEPRPDPYGPDARVSDAPVVDRNRVVVHTLPDPPLDAPPGTGVLATEALYAVLQHRLHLAIVPLGTGVTTVSVANEEAQRARARSVVMGRIDSFSSFMGPEGPVARMRLELTIVAEGRVVLRRVVLAETPAGAVASGVAQGRRGKLVDPVYLAMTRALDGQLAELQQAIFGNAAR